jgi:hypothetical protein
LGLFLLLGYCLLRILGQVVRLTKNRDGLKWMRYLGKMLQVSLIGDTASSAFWGLAYFDMYYALLALEAIVRTL